MGGWISIHRKIRDSWIYSEKPYSKFQAWIDLLLSASHKDNKFLLGNELIEVKTGEFVTSETKLAERWGWSRSKVRRFLELLQDDQMIERKSDSKKTTLNIVNYCLYQVSENEKEQQMNSERTANEQRADTINNVNNYNNDLDDDDDRQPIFLKVFEQEFKQLLTPSLVEEFAHYQNEGLADEVICEAIKRATLANTKNPRYILGILKNWNEQNIKTMVEVAVADEQFERQKERGQGNAKTDNKPPKEKPTRYPTRNMYENC